MNAHADHLSDVFVSHRWSDKVEFIESLVNALQGAGLSVWYDLLEIRPGQSLLDRINHGLTHSKVILLCVSERYFGGTWSPLELAAAVPMVAQAPGRQRIVVLMLGDPTTIQQSHPIPFASLDFIRWNADDIAGVAAKVRAAVEEVNRSGAAYWRAQMRDAWRDGNAQRTVNYAGMVFEHEPIDYEAMVYSVAGRMRLDDVSGALQLLREFEQRPEEIEEAPVDVDVLDAAQEELSRRAPDALGDDESFPRHVLAFFAARANAHRSWRYVARLLESPKFRNVRDDAIAVMLALSAEHMIEWLRETGVHFPDVRVRKLIANGVVPLFTRLKDRRPELIEIVRTLLVDRHEDVREAAVPVSYFCDPDGPKLALQALSDRAPEVRTAALEVLSGESNFEIDENGIPQESSEEKPTDPLLTPDVVRKLLADPDDLVFETVMEMLGDGRFPLPAGVDLDSIQRPPKEEIRAAEAGRLADDPTPENLAELMRLAADDGSTSVRESAARALEKLTQRLDAQWMRQTYERETVSDVREALESLMLEKGDGSLADLYLQFLIEGVESGESDLFLESKGKKVFGAGNRDVGREAVRYLTDHGRTALLAACGREILDLGLNDESSATAKLLVESNAVDGTSVLFLASSPTVPDERLELLARGPDLRTRVNALRGLESRRHDGVALQKLRDIAQELRPRVLAFDNEALWVSLEIIDGVMEFGSRGEAIEMLRRYYDDLLTTHGDHSFPLRAAFDRLAVLGVDIPHPVYVHTDDVTPYPWPSPKGPFFGITAR